MSLTYRSTQRNRVYTRKFDHEEAKRRYEAGESPAALAREYGVTINAVRRVVIPGERARMAATALEHHRRKGNPSQYWDCPDCGARARKGHRCRACYLIARYEERPQPIDAVGRVYCYRCRAYRPADEFSFDPRWPKRGFRREVCRACDSARRQDYRERHKLPCVGCGRPALPPNEKGTRGARVPRCRACFHAWQREQRGRPAA